MMGSHSGPATIGALLLIASLPATAQDFAELLELRRVKETLALEPGAGSRICPRSPRSTRSGSGTTGR